MVAIVKSNFELTEVKELTNATKMASCVTLFLYGIKEAKATRAPKPKLNEKKV